MLHMVFHASRPTQKTQSPWASQYFDQMALIMAHHIPVRSTSRLLQGANGTTLVQPATHGNAPTHALQPSAFPLNLHQWNAQQGQQVLNNGSQPSNSQALPLQCNAPECQQVPSQGAQHPNGQALSLQSQQAASQSQQAAPQLPAPSGAIVPVPAPDQEGANKTLKQEVAKNKNGKATKDTGPVEPTSFQCHVRKAASPEDEKTCSCQGCQDCQGCQNCQGQGCQQREEAKGQGQGHFQGPRAIWLHQVQRQPERLCHLQKAKFQRFEGPWQRGLVPYVHQCQVVMDQCGHMYGPTMPRCHVIHSC